MHTHKNHSYPYEDRPETRQSSDVQLNLDSHTPTHAAHRACSSVKKVTSSDELWEMVVIFSEVTYETANPGCGLPLVTQSHVSHFRGWKPRRGTKTTSIKPPLILIHFVVSRELPLIKCVPDCIMGVNWGHLCGANSPHYSHETLSWSELKSWLSWSLQTRYL